MYLWVRAHTSPQMYVPLKNTLLKIQIQIHKNTTRKVDVSADQCPAIIRQMEQWSTNGAIGSHSVLFFYILYLGSHSIQRKPSFPRTAFVKDGSWSSWSSTTHIVPSMNIVVTMYGQLTCNLLREKLSHNFSLTLILLFCCQISLFLHGDRTTMVTFLCIFWSRLRNWLLLFHFYSNGPHRILQLYSAK